jgi:formate/nitrite transporter
MGRSKLLGQEITTTDKALPIIVEEVTNFRTAMEELKKCANPECKTPAEMAVKMEATGITKAKGDFFSLSVLGMLAGFFIGLGAMFATLVTTDISIGFGLTKLAGGLVFSLGLILVVLAGAELFTGNALMVGSRISGKISVSKMLRNWGIVYFANLVGSLVLVALIYYSNFWAADGFKVGANSIAIANAKANLPLLTAFVRGILCNILVCLAVWLCFGARTTIDKIFAIIFPITAFVACGFEHSIANMYFIPMGIALAGKAEVLNAGGITAAQVANLNVIGFINNLIPVTLGNIVGGTLVGGVYWYVYLRKERAADMLAARPWLNSIFARRPATQLAAAQVNPETDALVRVLAKARDDNAFLARLTENSHKALEGYNLSPEAKAALASGDVRWLESRVGVLDQPLKTWLESRLSQEKW